jgi:hypothetical protein
MTEDTLTIYRQRSSEPSKSEIKLFDEFIKDNNLEDPFKYQAGDYYCYNMDILNTDIKYIKKLLIDLKNLEDIKTVAEYYFDKTGEEVYFIINNGEFEEYETLNDASDAECLIQECSNSSINTKTQPNKSSKFMQLSRESEENQEFNCHTSMIKLYLKKTEKKNIINYVNQCIGGSPDPFSHVWDGSIEPIFNFVDSIIDKGSNIVILINVYDQELFPDFPNSEQVKYAIEGIKETNMETKEQQSKDLAKLGFSEEEMKELFVVGSDDEFTCRQELKGIRFCSSVETFFNNLLKVDGVEKAAFVFRSHIIGDDIQLEGIGAHSGEIHCDYEDMSDRSSWVE